MLWAGRVGGIERLVHDLARAQLELGADVGVAFANEGGPFAAAAREAGATVVDLGLNSGYDLRPGQLSRAGAQLRRWQVVHLHGFNVPLAIAVARSGRPIVYTDHGSVPVGGRRAPAEWAKRRLLGRFLRRSVRKVAANSRRTAERAVQLYGVDSDSLTVVHNGVAMVANATPAASRMGGVVSAAFVGRLVPFKRVDRLISAAALVPRTARVEVIVIGAGPEEAALREQARRLNIEDRVRFLGLVTDVGQILREADILVQPSQGEPFGLAILEGCSHGLLPIVFADGGGALEAIPPDGLVVDSAEDLAIALSQLARSSALAAPARKARAAWVEERFSIERTARAYARLYESALRQSSRATASE